MKRFSIITVCYNAETFLRETIQSVLEQNNDNYEYIVKDGGSTDGTLEIARSFSHAFEKRGISYRVISCPDTGVYDAMNQAVEASCGEWLNFLNAGDWLFDGGVLGQVEAFLTTHPADIVYGDTYYRDRDWYRYGKAFPMDIIPFRLPFVHQSAFIRRELLLENPYDRDYPICADYNFFIRMYLAEKVYAHCPCPISIYENNGISANMAVTHREVLRLLENLPVRYEEAIESRKKRIDDLSKWMSAGRMVYLYRKLPLTVRKAIDHVLKPKLGWMKEKEFLAVKRGENGGVSCNP